MTPYATEADLTGYLSVDVDVPSDVDQMLRDASHVVDQHITASFDVDADGFPVLAFLRDAVVEATCAQAEFWMETMDRLGVDTWHSVSIASVTLSQSTSKSSRRLAPQAESVLFNAGLFNVGRVA